MIVEFSLTKEDLFAFTYYTQWSAPEKRNYRIRYYLKIIGYSFLGFLIVFMVKRDDDMMRILKWLIPVGLIWGLIMAYIGIEVRYKNRIRKFFDDEKNAGMYSRVTLHLSDNG